MGDPWLFVGQVLVGLILFVCVVLALYFLVLFVVGVFSIIRAIAREA